ncbi:MAG: hypothetical protein ACI4KI_06745 [Candidatus Fimenecus sp.]
MSLIIMVVGLLSLFIVGFPATYLVFQKKAESDFGKTGIWALSPFTGYALITGILKLLVSFDIPIKYTAYPFIAVFAVAFVAFCIWCRRKKKDIAPPLPFCFLAIAIVALFSISYFIIGAKYYRSFGWWDLFFYGSQAEFLKESAFSSLDELCNTQPYLGATQWYFNGCHRISRGAIQAFVAALCGVDGASTLGFISITSVVFVFCALLYFVSDLKLKNLHRYLASFFGATLPIVIMTELQGFVPVCLFMSFAAVFCKLFIDSLDEFSIPKAMFAGTLTASFVSTLLDATYLYVGILGISCFYMMVKNKQIIKPIGSSVIITVVAVAWNIPFLKNFMLELSGSVSRQGLNFIYPFAYTQKTLNYTFYGTTLEGFPGIFFMAMRFVTVILLIAGVCGTVMYFFKKHNGEALNSLAVIILPTLFMCMDDDFSYSFFKLYSLAAPLIAVGIWLFWDCARSEFKKVTVNLNTKWGEIFKSVVLKGGTIALSVFFIGCTGLGVRKTLMPIHAYADGDYSNKDTECLGVSYTDEWINFYEQLESHENENILLVGGDVELGYWWSTYHGRNNLVCSLTKEMDNTYFKYKEYDRTDIEKLPLDCKIYVMPNCDNIVSPESAQENVAAVLQLKTGNNTFATRRNVSAMASSAFKMPIYSKIDCKATVCLTLKSNAGDSITFYVNGTEYTADTKAKEYRIDIDLKAGANYCTIETNSDSEKLEVSYWELVCNSK